MFQKFVVTAVYHILFYFLNVFILVALHKIEIFWIQLFNTLLLYEFYRDPGKGNIFADSVITTAHVAFIFTDIVYSQCAIDRFETIENLLGKMYIECTLMSKSHNVALKQ